MIKTKKGAPLSYSSLPLLVTKSSPCGFSHCTFQKINNPFSDVAHVLVPASPHKVYYCDIELIKLMAALQCFAACSALCEWNQYVRGSPPPPCCSQNAFRLCEMSCWEPWRYELPRGHCAVIFHYTPVVLSIIRTSSLEHNIREHQILGLHKKGFSRGSAPLFHGIKLISAQQEELDKAHSHKSRWNDLIIAMYDFASFCFQVQWTEKTSLLNSNPHNQGH